MPGEGVAIFGTIIDKEGHEHARLGDVMFEHRLSGTGSEGAPDHAVVFRGVAMRVPGHALKGHPSAGRSLSLVGPVDPEGAVLLGPRVKVAQVGGQTTKMGKHVVLQYASSKQAVKVGEHEKIGGLQAVRMQVV